MYITSHLNLNIESIFFTVTDTTRITDTNYHFILVQDGSLEIRENDTSYILSAGDIILMQPQNSYYLHPINDNYALDVSCNASDFISQIPVGYHIVCNSVIGKKNDYIKLTSILLELASISPVKHNINLRCALIYHLFDLISLYYLVPDGSSSQSRTKDIARSRTQEIQNYLQNNYHLPLSLTMLADKMYLSPQYLSKFIKKNMGITFNKYLNNIRLEHAQQELLYTDHAITDIAFNNGFSSTSAFNKLYKEQFAHSPSVYRQMHQITESTSLLQNSTITAPSINKPDDLTHHFPQINVSANHFSSYQNSWTDTINLGSLQTALSNQFYQLVMDTLGKLHFQYIRFHNIFSLDLLHPLQDEVHFDCNKLDLIFDFFKNADICPFIDLCHHKQLTSDEIAYQCKALTYILNHGINRYGYAYVSHWRFEITAARNEVFEYLETPSEYLEKYQRYAKTIRKIVPECTIGGPGHHSSADPSFFEQCLSIAANSTHCIFDFFSLCSYSHELHTATFRSSPDNQTHFFPVSTDPDYLLHNYDYFRKMQTAFHMESIPLYITEFQSGANGKNQLAASCFQAAFLCHNMINNIDHSPCIAYYNLTDETTGANLSPTRYVTGTGLIDSHNIPKPVFFSYVFLQKLKKHLIYSSEHCTITTDGSGTYQILLCNYYHYNHYYCCNYQKLIDTNKTYDIFDDVTEKSISILLHDALPGRYHVTRHRINQEYGSLIDYYNRILDEGNITTEELNYMMLNMQQEEITYLMATIRHRQDVYYVDCPDKTLHIEHTLAPHEVCLLEYTRRL